MAELKKRFIAKIQPFATVCNSECRHRHADPFPRPVANSAPCVDHVEIVQQRRENTLRLPTVRLDSLAIITSFVVLSSCRHFYGLLAAVIRSVQSCSRVALLIDLPCNGKYTA